MTSPPWESLLGVEPGQQFLEILQRTYLAVHRESLAQGIAHPGVDGGGSHLHEPP